MDNQHDTRRARAWAAYQGYKRRHRDNFHTTVDTPLSLPPEAPSGYFEAERRRPARPPSFESDVGVPVLWGLAAGLVAGLVTLYLALTTVIEAAWHLSCLVGLVAAAIVAGLVFLVNSPTLWIIEKIVKEDLDGDGHIGEPPPVEPVKHTTRLEITESTQDGKAIKIVDTDIDPLLLHRFAVAVNRGDGFAVRTANRESISRELFEEIRNEFLTSGWAQWSHPTNKKQGVDLTTPGKAIIRQLASDPPTLSGSV